mmetsp:Transcript_34575/g.61672  ORF Transcript_34575/g.61672 Transcript_34575/m.61672 type:complete len:221 (-) Transcript_34575:826-1488(-)
MGNEKGLLTSALGSTNLFVMQPASSVREASSSSDPNIAPMARAACSIPVLAREGAPRTSPAAYTFIMLVCSLELTLIALAGVTSMPTFSSPRVPEFGLRPRAIITASATGSLLCTPPLHTTHRNGPSTPSGASTSSSSVSVITVIPLSSRSRIRRAAMVGSSPLATRLFAASPRIRTVTLQSRRRKILANSSAMMPPPWITMDLGKKDRPLIVSESNTRL